MRVIATSKADRAKRVNLARDATILPRKPMPVLLVLITVYVGLEPTFVSPAAISWQPEPFLTFRRSDAFAGAGEALRLAGGDQPTLYEKRLL